MIDTKDNIERFPIQRVAREDKQDTEGIVIRELPLTIILNNRELVTLLCSPTDLKYLAIGFLASEGFLKSKDEINRIIVDDRRGVVRVETKEDKELASELIFKRLITSGCGRGASFYSATDTASQKVDSQMKISAHEVFALAHEFQHSSQLYLATHGVHSSALCDTKNILVFSEDIGRHNAIDKIIGECFLKDIPTEDRLIITSGRISSEILHKVAKRGIPVLISKSVPTNLGIRFANDLGITLIGFVRGKRMNVYANDWRVVTDGR